MRRGVSVAAMALLLVSLAVLPTASAGCPNPPRDCGSFVDLIEVDLGEAQFSVGVYEDHSDESDGTLRPGERGGILVIVRAPGSAASIQFDFESDISGIQWLNGNTLNITDAQEGDHYVLPFEVESVTTGLVAPFTATDSEGNSTSDAVYPFGVLVGAAPDPVFGLPDWAVMVLVAAVIVSLLVILRRRRR